MRGSEVLLLAGPPGPPSVVAPVVGTHARKRTANIDVTYSGFGPSAQAAFQRAVDIWETKISSTVTITVNANFENLGSSSTMLASGGPFRFVSCSTSCPIGVRKSVWYPIAIFNKFSKSDNDPENPDIQLRLNRRFESWHFGASEAPGNKIDLTSVALHALGHGLGFAGGASVSGGEATVRGVGGGLPTIFATFVVDNASVRLITRRNYPDPSAKLKDVIEGGPIFLKVRANNFKLFAPTPFQPDVSFSHLDEATFPRGDRNSLMTPALSQGETIRDPGPIVQKIMNAIGWK